MKKSELNTLVVAYREEIETAAQFVDDDELSVSMKALYPQWVAGILVQVNTKWRYNDILYKCLKEHVTDQLLPPDTEEEYWLRLG